MMEVSAMQYLGGLRGAGLLLCGDTPVARTEFSFDGYVLNTGQVACSGEINLPAAALQDVFGRNDLLLQTDDGRNLKLRFSDRRLAADATAAHVDVVSDLPTASAKDWHR
jgi:hypothetical protein